MEQINCFAFFDLGSTLRDCFAHARLPVKMWSGSAERARDQLKAMLDGDTRFKLDESRVAAGAMHATLDRVVTAHKKDGEYQQSEAETIAFNVTAYTFNEAISLELGRAPIFYVTPKGVYSTQRLIQKADAVYEGYADRLPSQTLADTVEAGRCLAFSLPTAAGFHIARAIESVIKVYMTAFGCPPKTVDQRNWGAYIKALEASAANKRVLHHLGQLKDLHRNPLTHPDETLSMLEAQALWSMGVSVIQAMVADMEPMKPSPASAIAAMLPPPSP